MPSTYTLIQAQTLTTTAASVTFSAIPSTFTDLVLQVSARGDLSNESVNLKVIINSDTSALYSVTTLVGDGATASSFRLSAFNDLRGQSLANGGGTTSNTFGNSELYFPNYLSTANKPISLTGAYENNATTARIAANAGLYRNTTAITTLELSPINATNWVANSSFYLYGIKNS